MYCTSTLTAQFARKPIIEESAKARQMLIPGREKLLLHYIEKCEKLGVLLVLI